mmetsp:Transcript_5801/g.9534  ORF Transcript_5801/g.9534 Transcript_5801/m.9534 type:complete len:291 (+) Transcript_5801:75-947(+)
MATAGPGAVAGMSARDQAKVAELEEELRDLKRKLSRQDAREAAGNGSLAKEVGLEKELATASEKIKQLKKNKQTLELTVTELKRRLHRIDVGATSSAAASSSVLAAISSGSGSGNAPGGGGGNATAMELALKRGEREKSLEKVLQRTKREKDKAVRIVIQLVGKERMNDFLNHHAGSADILDRLLNNFSDCLHINNQTKLKSGDSSSGSNSSSSPNKKPSPIKKDAHNASPSRRSSSENSPEDAMKAKVRAMAAANSATKKNKASPIKPPAQYRSRINEYYRQTVSNRDL